MPVLPSNAQRIRELELKIQQLEQLIVARDSTRMTPRIETAIVETCDPSTGSYPTSGSVVPIKFESGSFSAINTDPTFTDLSAGQQQLGAMLDGTLPAKGSRLLGTLVRGKWYLTDPTGGSGQAIFIHFSLNATLSTSTASVASCTVNDYWQGTNPGSTVTVYNTEANGSTYLFSGAANDEGIAVWHERDEEYRIIQLEC